MIHRDQTYPGEHEATVTKDLWDRAHAVIESNESNHAQPTRAKSVSLLKGIIRCGARDSAMSPVSTGGPHKIYRYYTCGTASKTGYSNCPVRSVPAGDIEEAVVQQLRAVFRSPEMIAQTYRATRDLESEELDRLREVDDELQGMQAKLVTERDVAECLRKLDPIWDELFPLEQTRIVHLLIEQVTVNPEGLNIKIRGNGLHSLVSEVRATTDRSQRSITQ